MSADMTDDQANLRSDFAAWELCKAEASTTGKPAEAGER